MADFRVNKCAKRFEEEDLDRLSQLPDDILAHILSLLSMEEASRTSLLSTSWKRRWLFAIDKFNFDSSRFIKPRDLVYLANMKLNVPVLRGKFFEWVDMVLESLHPLEEASGRKFRLQFPLFLDDWYAMKIDKWLSFALAKRVQSLELDFVLCRTAARAPTGSVLHGGGYYCYCFPRRVLDETDMSCLRSLSLSGINVSREDIDFLLLKCSFLEHLKVCDTTRLESVEICNSSLALKHLEITHCYGLMSVIVRDTCLVSLTLTSSPKLVLENNPKLVSLCVSEAMPLQVLSSCYLSRLQILTLNLNCISVEILDQVPQLNEMKKISLNVEPGLKEILVRITTLLNLSPKLEKLVLEFFATLNPGRKVQYKRSRRVPLQHLKTVEVRKYYGSDNQDKLLTNILKHVVAPIERIIFDPRTYRKFVVPAPAMSIERRAEQLRRVVDMSVERFRHGKKRVMSSPIELSVLDGCG